MYRKWILIASVCFLAASVSADTLTLSTDAPPGSPLVVNHGAVSGPLIVSVTNDTASDDAVNQLTGWQTTFEIIADQGATGTLIFKTGTEPANYIFNGVSHTNFPGSMNTDTRQLFIGASFAGGVQVPTAPGTGLWELTFEASPGASGTFGLFVIDNTESFWSDAFSPNTRNRDFANVPASGGPVRIGEILIIPEPSSLAAWGIGGGLLVLVRRRALRG